VYCNKKSISNKCCKDKWNKYFISNTLSKSGGFQDN